MEYLGIVVGGSVVAFIWGLVLQHKRKMKELDMRGADQEWGPEVDALRDDLDDTRAQLAHLQERIELSERVLAAGRASQEDRSG